MSRKETWFKSSRGMERRNYCIINHGARLVASVTLGCREIQNSNCAVNFWEGTMEDRRNGGSVVLAPALRSLVQGGAAPVGLELNVTHWGSGNIASREIIPHKSNCFGGLCEHVVWRSSWCSGNGGALSKVVQQRIQKMKLLQDGLLLWIINWLKVKKQRITWFW